MGDINNLRVLWLKFGLFVFVGIMATAIALFFFPYPKLACLMAIAIWAFCRAYYFAFYVIEHYADPNYRFAGLVSFLRYALRNRKNTDTDAYQGFELDPQPPSGILSNVGVTQVKK